jgi:drug/metabolite transporter (DMT)-like permease
MTAPSSLRAQISSAPPWPVVYLPLSFAVTAWGGSFVAARIVLHAASAGQAVLTPTVLATVRFGLASVVFLPPLVRAIGRREVAAGDLLRMGMLGQLMYSIYFWLQYTGLQQTSASVASILVVGLVPLATAALAQVLDRERLTRTSVASLLLGCCGVVLIALPQGLHLDTSAGFVFGCACLVSNAVAFAVYSNLGKRWMHTISPLVMTSGTMVSGALGLLVLSLIGSPAQSWTQVARLAGAQWLAVLYLALVCSVAAFYAYNGVLAQIPASRAATFVYFEPVIAVGLSVTLLHERLAAQSLLGGAIIAVSVVLLHLQRRRG